MSKPPALPNNRESSGDKDPSSPASLEVLQGVLKRLEGLREASNGDAGNLDEIIADLRKEIQRGESRLSGTAEANPSDAVKDAPPASSKRIERDSIDVTGDVKPGGVVGDGEVRAENIAGNNVVHNKGVHIERAEKVYVSQDGKHGKGPKRAPDDERDLEKTYLLWLRESASRIPLGKLDSQMGMAGQDTPNIRLDDVYVPLNIMRTQDSTDDPDSRVPVPLLRSVNLVQRLVILGDPGSGKSSFLNFITLALVGARMEPKKKQAYFDLISAEPEGGKRAVNWKRGALLPVRIELREFVDDIPTGEKRGTANLVWQHIVKRLKDHKLEGFAPEIERALEKGKALVMFDGLDEVAEQKQRRIVRDAVTDFAQRYPASRLLVTCRVLSYIDPDWQLGSFSSVTLAPLSRASIDLFIGRWYQALVRLGHIDASRARIKTQQLRAATTYLNDLARNPMLLTVMSVVHFHKGTLHRERARLYNDCVNLLLWEWQRTKQVGPDEWERGIVEELETREDRLMNGLCEVAYQAHNAQDKQKSMVNIPEAEVLRVLRRYLDNDWEKAERFCQYVEKRAGLLIGKGHDSNDEAMYAFPHRGFQEFMAACHVALDRDFDRSVARLACKGDIWREVLLLAVGHMVYNNRDIYRPLNAINALCKPQPPTNPASWRSVWWAGEMLTIVGRTAAEADDFLGKDLVPRVIQQLVQLVEKGHLTPVERAQAADALGILGDPRRGVISVEPVLIDLPGGPFKMGGDAEPHPVTLKPFKLARYTVTNEQFQRFVEEGYEKDRFWTTAGLTWRRRNGQRSTYRRDQSAGIPNRPVVSVTWYEAMAYANWLAAKTKKKYRLPTEAEWERAAAGLEGRLYPFANRASDDMVNTREAGVGETAAVGTFPTDRTPEGINDMGGNVWEWCSSLGKKYPYNARDGRENPQAGGARILRGGAYDNSRSEIHSTQRRPVEPHARVPLIGFRLACDG